MLKRIKRIRSHVGHSQFLRDCRQDGDDGYSIIGYIPLQLDIPSPYAYSQFWGVADWNGLPVVVRETSHRCYDVFAVPREMILTCACHPQRGHSDHYPECPAY